MRPNKKEPDSAPFWFQSISIQVACVVAFYKKQVARMAASYKVRQVLMMLTVSRPSMTNTPPETFSRTVSTAKKTE